MNGNFGYGDASVQDIGVDNPANNPEDSVSCLRWMPDPNVYLLACSSWDGMIRFYEIQASGP